MKMMFVLGEASCSRIRVAIPGLLALGVALIMGGCAATPISINTNPPGATVYARGKTVGVTPAQLTPEGNTPMDIELRLSGYFPETATILPGTQQREVSVRLEPTTLKKEYDVTSAPVGASVYLDGRSVGTTPLAGLSVVYERDDKFAPWKPHSLSVAKTNYQGESFQLNAATDTVPAFNLALLKDDRAYRFTATTADGQELNADVTLGGKVVGQTPLTVTLTFQRANKSQAWPRFDYSVEIPAKYKPVTGTIDYANVPNIPLKLEPIVEITTHLVGPAVVLTPTGVELKGTSIAANAVLSTREPAEIISDLKPVTDYRRKDLKDAAATRAESINSYCVAPDGQNVIFSLTERDEDGNLFANLFIKRSDDAAGGVARLTQGTRAWDTLPYIANDGSNYLVFASNRSDRTKPDIYRVSLIDNRLSGGISRLTNDNRFNYAPSYGDSNRQLFYLSTEPNFPRAESVVSSIRIDGSLPTQMAITALEINNTFAEKVVFVRMDADTKTKQIYSITADGKLETALVNQEDFRKSNCFNPAVSPDGTRILFVSDQGVDDQGRHNNDIYLANADGTGLHRVTQNGSDDILPAWSPSEEGVVYFLSNRGGAYNIWRVKLSAGTK
jgi:hypothetical protein